ncbi:hypothetical protein ACGFNY_43980 [Streptomyces chartreusis]|uniref:hypothetical protein n=1 Tax=Streptomyces chartreusis TaxID=1969 RepID=UPI003719335B
MTKTDPRILQIAIRRQGIARKEDSRLPRWDQLPAEERDRLLAESAAWLRAAVEARLMPLAERPTDKHAAVYLDDYDELWAEYPSVPHSDSETAIVPLVWASEQCKIKQEMEVQGTTFRLIGWSE